MVEDFSDARDQHRSRKEVTQRQIGKAETLLHRSGNWRRLRFLEALPSMGSAKVFFGGGDWRGRDGFANH